MKMKMKMKRTILPPHHHRLIRKVAINMVAGLSFLKKKKKNPPNWGGIVSLVMKKSFSH